MSQFRKIFIPGNDDILYFWEIQLCTSINIGEPVKIITCKYCIIPRCLSIDEGIESYTVNKIFAVIDICRCSTISRQTLAFSFFLLHPRLPPPPCLFTGLTKHYGYFRLLSTSYFSNHHQCLFNVLLRKLITQLLKNTNFHFPKTSALTTPGIYPNFDFQI